MPGGVQSQVLGLARELRRQGHEARVLGPCDGPPPEAFVTPLGDSLPTAANGSMAPLAPDASAALRTIRALRDEQFDVVHVHEPMAPGPSMTTVTMRPAPLVGDVPRGRAVGQLQDLPSARCCGWPAASTARSSSPRTRSSWPSRRLGGEYDILFNGVEEAAIAATPPTPTDGPTIFFCGRHEERKGLAVLLEAFSALPPDARLWIASDGPAGPPLRAAYASDRRISWLGRISDPEKFARLRGSSVFCAPSLHGESFGVVLIEAMAAGTAVVASGLEGYRNVATDGVDALLVEPGDVAALTKALTTVLVDRGLADSLRQAGLRRAKDFSMATLAEEYVRIYRQLLEERPSGPTLRRRIGRRVTKRCRALRVVPNWAGGASRRFREA